MRLVDKGTYKEVWKAGRLRGFIIEYMEEPYATNIPLMVYSYWAKTYYYAIVDNVVAYSYPTLDGAINKVLDERPRMHSSIETPNETLVDTLIWQDLIRGF